MTPGSPTSKSPEDWEARYERAFEEWCLDGCLTNSETDVEVAIKSFIRAERERLADALMVEEKKDDRWKDQRSSDFRTGWNAACAEMRKKREGL